MTELRAHLRLRELSGSAAAQLVVGLIVVVVGFSLLYSQFATGQNLENMARQGAILLVVAIGQMAVLLVGGFDISVGATMGFASVVGGEVMLAHGLWAGIAAGLAAGAAVGLVNGFLVAKVGLSPFITTLGMLTFLTGLTNQLTGGTSVFGFPSSFRAFGAGQWGPIPATVGIAAIVVVLAWFMLNRTRPGFYVYAIGGSRDTSVLAGVRVARFEIGAYVSCSLLAAVGGLMLASRVSVAQASLGQGYELLSIATAVMGGVAIGGGVGGITGVVVGVALLTSLTTGLNIAGVSSFIQQMFIGAVVIAAVSLSQARSALASTWRSVVWRSRSNPETSPPLTAVGAPDSDQKEKR